MLYNEIRAQQNDGRGSLVGQRLFEKDDSLGLGRIAGEQGRQAETFTGAP